MNQERWDARLRLLPCAVCVALELPSPNPCHELHHLGDPHTSERNEMAKIPICEDHHQGENGIHRLRRAPWKLKFGLSDLRLLTVTLIMMAKELA